MNNIGKKYNDNLNVLGEQIRFHREKNHLSQAELSAKLELLGISIPKNSIQKLESNNRIIKDYELGAISKVLKFSLDSIYSDYISKL